MHKNKEYATGNGLCDIKLHWWPEAEEHVNSDHVHSSHTFCCTMALYMHIVIPLFVNGLVCSFRLTAVLNWMMELLKRWGRLACFESTFARVDSHCCDIISGHVYCLEQGLSYAVIGSPFLVSVLLACLNNFRVSPIYMVGTFCLIISSQRWSCSSIKKKYWSRSVGMQWIGV